MFDFESPQITNIWLNYSGTTGIGSYWWMLPSTYLHTRKFKAAKMCPINVGLF